jgi:hypothetical protein
MRRRYRLYIDESGDHTYHQIDALEKRYLGLIGCVFSFEHYLKFQKDLENLKRKHFSYDPDFPVILHRTGFINRKGSFGCLVDRELEASFNQDFLGLLKQATFEIIAVVIDKKSHIKRYSESAFHPYHYCMACLLERYCGYLNCINAEGDVLAESRGGKEDKQLKEVFQHIYFEGTQRLGASFFQKTLTTREIKLKRKNANIAGLQLADLLAYPIKQDILVKVNRISEPGDVFGKVICEVVQGKYIRHLSQVYVEGYEGLFFK